MDSDNHHIIQKQVFHLDLQGIPDGYALQKQIGELMWQKLQPELEKLFDRFADPEELIRIERLEIDIGNLPLRDLDDLFNARILAELETQLYRFVRQEHPKVKRQPLHSSRFVQWLYFLEHGSASWPLGRLSEAQLQRDVLEAMASDSSAIRQLETLLRRSPVALKRLIWQYGEGFLTRLVETISASKQAQLPALAKELELLFEKRDQWAPDHHPGWVELTGHRPVRDLFWTAIFANSIGKEPSLDPAMLFTTVLSAWVKGRDSAFPLLFRQLHNYLLQRKQSLPIVARAVAEIEKSPERYFQTTKTAARGERVVESRKKDQPEGSGKDTDTEPPPGTLTDDQRSRDGKGKDQETTSTDGPGLKEEREAPLPDDKKEKAFSEEKIRGKSPFGKKEVSPEEGASPSEAHARDTLPEIPSDDLIRDYPGQSSGIPEYSGDTAIYVQHAGVVLLHAFLPGFFRKLDLLKGAQFADEQARQRSVHLVQYLATGKTGMPEYEMTVPKMLCGFPLNYPVEREIVLTDPETEEAEKLLRAVIEHWKALKSTSPSGLREGFLLRDGKLEKRPSDWYLMVEQKAMDILLDRLPWTIGMIQLPWMKDMLRVEWS